MNSNALITTVLLLETIESSAVGGNSIRRERSFTQDAKSLSSNSGQTDNYYSSFLSYMGNFDKSLHDRGVWRNGPVFSPATALKTSDTLAVGDDSLRMRQMVAVDVKGREYSVLPDSLSETATTDMDEDAHRSSSFETPWTTLVKHAKNEPGKGGSQILYSIQTSPKPPYAARLAAILKTWAKDLSPDQLQIIGTDAPKSKKGTVSDLAGKAHWDSAPLCLDSHEWNSCKDATGIVEAMGVFPQWLVLVGDDNYVDTKNMEEVLDRKDPDIPVIFGVKGCGANTCPGRTGIGLCGGAGQIFSRGALMELMRGGRFEFLEEHERVRKLVGNWGDVATACVAANRKNPIPIELLPGLHGWKLNKHDMIVALKNKPLTFHYVSPVGQSLVQSELDELDTHATMSAGTTNATHNSFDELDDLKALIQSEKRDMDNDQHETKALMQSERRDMDNDHNAFQESERGDPDALSSSYSPFPNLIDGKSETMIHEIVENGDQYDDDLNEPLSIAQQEEPISYLQTQEEEGKYKAKYLRDVHDFVQQQNELRSNAEKTSF